MADKLPNGDDKKGFAGFASLVSDVTKDIEQLSRQEISENKVDARPPHVRADSTLKSKKPSAKFYAGLIAGALFIAWIGGGFNSKDHAAKILIRHEEV